MATNYQELGELGEKLIAKECICPKCKNNKTLKRLGIKNFKCADIICDFCGYLAQVKTKTVSDIEKFPSKVLGAAWGPQKERMDAGIYFPLFVVLKNGRNHSVFYLSSDLQTEEMFIKRKPLSKNAKRAGWQGFYFDGELMKKFISRLL